MLTEPGSRKRARVGLYSLEGVEFELARLGPDALGIGAAALVAILRSEARRLHPLLRDQRALAGIGRVWANEILLAARLPPYLLPTELTEEEVGRLATAIDDELLRGLALRASAQGSQALAAAAVAALR